MLLHPLIGDHAVFQRGKPITIHGTASPRAEISVAFAGKSRSMRADSDGAWEVQFPPMQAGGPFELIVEGEGRTIRREDILIGEVWLCSGQSNMEWSLAMTPGSEDDIAAANDPQARCFMVMRTPAAAPAAEPDGRWEVATSHAAGNFSAVAWFFARRLREKLGCPVGILVPAFGGTRIVSWLSKETLASRPEYVALREAETPGDSEELKPHPDPGRTPECAGWEEPGYDDSAWEELEVPGLWQQQGWQLNGAVWYRLAVDLPAGWKGEELVLFFGACDDFDDAFVNGVRVGGMGPEVASSYATRREYPVTAEMTAGGRLTIAVRVFDQWGFGGIVNGAALRLASDPEQKISLERKWKAKVEQAFPLRTSARPIPPEVLYNGMVHPLLRAGIRGFLWYQGESDVALAALYRTLLPDLIASWRRAWGDPLLPFGIVQLANFQPPMAAEFDWAELRDAQLLAATTVPRAGLAVAIDTGEPKNIHPRLKKPVGERLALWALAEVYGIAEDVWRSPVPADHWIKDGAVFVRFAHAGAGLRSRDGRALQAFRVAGPDARWVRAGAEIVAPDVVKISSPEVPDPTAARHAWENWPDVNLENSAGLPASPFRTDDWELTTQGR